MRYLSRWRSSLDKTENIWIIFPRSQPHKVDWKDQFWKIVLWPLPYILLHACLIKHYMHREFDGIFDDIYDGLGYNKTMKGTKKLNKWWFRRTCCIISKNEKETGNLKISNICWSVINYTDIKSQNHRMWFLGWIQHWGHMLIIKEL